MKRVVLISTIILLVINVGCRDSKQSDILNDGILTVDVLKSYPKKELILQDFLDVEYIPLETSDEFITAGNIQAIGKEVIIVKNTARRDGNIFLFDRKGKGLRTINRLGQGSEEYTNVLEVTLDEDNNEIYINNYFLLRTVVYDLFGNFKRSFKHIEGSFYPHIDNFDSDYLICYVSPTENRKPDEKRNCFVLVSKQDGSVKEIPIPYEELKSSLIVEKQPNGEFDSFFIRNRPLIPYRGSWVCMEVSADTIYTYSPSQELTPFIVRTPSIQTMNPEVFLYASVFTDRYYFMQTAKKTFDFMTDTDVPRTDLVYDKQENAIYEYVLYNDDFTDKILVNLMVDRYMLTIFNNDEIAFARKLEAFDLVEAYQEGKLKGELKEIAAELDEESNGVIMLAKYKK